MYGGSGSHHGHSIFTQALSLTLNRMPKTPPSPDEQLPIPLEFIERRIYVIRGLKVMLDADLAELYQAPTKALNQAVRRNLDRFPEDFMFQLTGDELENWRSQFVTSSPAAKMDYADPLRFHRARRGDA